MVQQVSPRYQTGLTLLRPRRQVVPRRCAPCHVAMYAERARVYRDLGPNEIVEAHILFKHRLDAAQPANHQPSNNRNVKTVWSIYTGAQYRELERLNAQ